MAREQHWQSTDAATWYKRRPEVRRMRHEPTHAEGLLWAQPRNRALGVRFRRQHAIDRYIVDFCCLEAKLVIEADGVVHESQVEHDDARDGHLRSQGSRILRFSNDTIESDIESVLAAIASALKADKPKD